MHGLLARPLPLGAVEDEVLEGDVRLVQVVVHNDVVEEARLLGLVDLGLGARQPLRDGKGARSISLYKSTTLPASEPGLK